MTHSGQLCTIFRSSNVLGLCEVS